MSKAAVRSSAQRNAFRDEWNAARSTLPKARRATRAATFAADATTRSIAWVRLSTEEQSRAMVLRELQAVVSVFDRVGLSGKKVSVEIESCS